MQKAKKIYKINYSNKRLNKFVEIFEIFFNIGTLINIKHKPKPNYDS